MAKVKQILTSFSHQTHGGRLILPVMGWTTTGLLLGTGRCWKNIPGNQKAPAWLLSHASLDVNLTEGRGQKEISCMVPCVMVVVPLQDEGQIPP